MFKRRVFPRTLAEWPFFYGWVVIAVGAIGTLATAPGQTIGVSVFNDFLIEVLSINRVLLSTAYMIGTTTSALFLARAGRVLDRRGSRVVGTAAAVGLGISVFGMTQIDHAAAGLAAAFGGTVIPAAITLSFGFFLLRFFGQGVLMLSSRNMILKWFDKSRGKVNAILGITVTLGFAYAPRVFEAVIRAYSWRVAWALVGAALLAFAVVAAVFYRDNPTMYGLTPDGPLRDRPKRRRVWIPRRFANLTPVGASTGTDRTLGEARKTVTFWVFLLVLTLSSAIGTAFTFHVVSIFETAGLSRLSAVSVFLPASVVGIVVKFISSWASDYVPIRIFPILHAAALILQLVAIIVLRSPATIALVILSHGVMQGLLTVNANLAWPRLFGLAQLGTITGFTMTWTVVGSAVGPYIFSVFFNLSGSYTPVSIILILPCLVLGGLAIWAYRRHVPVARG